MNKVVLGMIFILAFNFSNSTSKQVEKSHINIDKNIYVNYGENLINIKAIPENNIDIINKEINIIENEKIIYKNFFNKLQNDNYVLNIYLVNSFEDKTIATAERKGKQFNIYISRNKDFKRALDHEMLHCIEYYLKDTYCIDLFAKWNEYNPKDFNYTKDINNLTDEYVNKVFNKNIYFVTKYSKTSEKEDRAEIFAEIMSNSNMWQISKNIENKTNYLLDILYKYDIITEL